MKSLRAGCLLWLCVTICLGIVIGVARMLNLPDQELATVAIANNHSDIFLINTSRDLEINLTRSRNGDAYPAWSPDGQHLLLYTERNQRTDLYLMQLSDGTVKQLVASGGPGAAPAWSGDGQWIAFSTIHAPNQGLYIVRPDGSGARRLTDIRVFNLVWSPDNDQIAFIANCDSNCDIYVVTLRDNKVRQLTHNGLVDAYPAWSPDSRQLVFVSSRSMSYELYIIDIDCDEMRIGGCTTKRLTQNRAADSFPAWSPDGKQIAFSSDRSGNYELYTVPADCYRATKGCKEEDAVAITHRDATDILPLWSSDGRQIAFLSADHTVDFGVYTLNLADGRVKLRQRNITNDAIVVWRPNPP